MANEQNLKKGRATQFQSGEKAARSGQKGGIASGESKRKTKTFREALRALLESEVPDAQLREALEQLGFEPTYLNQISLSSVKKAVQGDIEAARFVRDTIGEKPRDGLEIGNLDGKPLTSLELSKLTDEELLAMAAQCVSEEE